MDASFCGDHGEYKHCMKLDEVFCRTCALLRCMHGNRLVCFQVLDRFPRKYLPISATGSCHADEADESQSVLDVLGDGEVSEGAIPPFQLWRSEARHADALVERVAPFSWDGACACATSILGYAIWFIDVRRRGSVRHCDGVTVRSGASRCERLGTRTTC